MDRKVSFSLQCISSPFLRPIIKLSLPWNRHEKCSGIIHINTISKSIIPIDQMLDLSAIMLGQSMAKSARELSFYKLADAGPCPCQLFILVLLCL